MQFAKMYGMAPSSNDDYSQPMLHLDGHSFSTYDELQEYINYRRSRDQERASRREIPQPHQNVGLGSLSAGDIPTQVPQGRTGTGRSITDAQNALANAAADHLRHANHPRITVRGGNTIGGAITPVGGHMYSYNAEWPGEVRNTVGRVDAQGFYQRLDPETLRGTTDEVTNFTPEQVRTLRSVWGNRTGMTEPIVDEHPFRESRRRRDYREEPLTDVHMLNTRAMKKMRRGAAGNLTDRARRVIGLDSGTGFYSTI